MHALSPRIHLFDGDAIVKSVDRHVLLAVLCGVVDKGDDGGVKFVLDRKHGIKPDDIGGASQAPIARLCKWSRFRARCAVQVKDKEMRFRGLLLGLPLVFAAACQDVALTPAPQPDPAPVPTVARTGSPQNLSDFTRVVARVEPVAERACRQSDPRANCDFFVRVDRDPRKQPNAFQSLSDSGRPVITFTETLIRQTLNDDELAFIFAHEAAHHIEKHIPRIQGPATAGAVIGGILAEALGAGQAGVEIGQQLGGTVTATRFSREFELEADALGTRITAAAGYDPVRGAAYFSIVPDPSNQFLATHPPNADRVRTVQRVAAGL